MAEDCYFAFLVAYYSMNDQKLKTLDMTINGLNENELEHLADQMMIAIKKSGGKFNFSGTNYYPPLLILNILIKYFDEFQNSPFRTYLKYFPSASSSKAFERVYAIRNTNCKELEIEREFRIRAAKHDCVLPSEMGMKSYYDVNTEMEKEDS